MARLAISTNTPGWQSQCLDFAKAKSEFELIGYEMEHFHFCEDLCREYGYTLSCRIHGDVVRMLFRPKVEAPRE